MKVLITGASGLVGSALTAALAAGGHEPIPLLRKNAEAGKPFWNPEHGEIDLAAAGHIDAVVNLAGENIAAGRWNDRRKARILNSRVKGTKLLAEYFSTSADRPRVIVSASAIGVYGDRGDELLDENSAKGSGFLAQVCREWEAAIAPAAAAGIRVVNARLGVVLAANGGALQKIVFPFRMGLGGVVGSGKQYMSWVSLDDAVEMIQHVIANDSLRGPVNLVSPNPVTNREFTTALGRALRRPTVFPLPAFAARLAFGEMADEMLLASARVAPRRLAESGYRFRNPELSATLEALLGRAERPQ